MRTSQILQLRGKYLYFFRFQYPIDWINSDDHEEIELVFINADSEQDALEWGNCIAERFIEELLIIRNVALRKIVFSGFIWAKPNHIFTEAEKEESKDLQVVDNGEYPNWNFERNK